MRFLRRINLNRYKKGAECAFSILILRAYKPVEVEQVNQRHPPLICAFFKSRLRSNSALKGLRKTKDGYCP